MAMPKKGSRSIVVDGQKYRWSVRFTEDDTSSNKYGMEATVTVSVENYDNPQSMLCISYVCGFRYGLDEAQPRSVATGQVMEIMPDQVADMIRDALAQGWKPTIKGGKFLLQIPPRGKWQPKD